MGRSHRLAVVSPAAVDLGVYVSMWMFSVLLDGHPGVALRGPSSVFKRVDCLCFCAHWNFCPFAAALAAQPLGAVGRVDAHCPPHPRLCQWSSSDPASAAQAAFSQCSGSSPCRPGVSLLSSPGRTSALCSDKLYFVSLSAVPPAVTSPSPPAHYLPLCPVFPRASNLLDLQPPPPCSPGGPCAVFCRLSFRFWLVG